MPDVSHLLRRSTERYDHFSALYFGHTPYATMETGLLPCGSDVVLEFMMAVAFRSGGERQHDLHSIFAARPMHLLPASPALCANIMMLTFKSTTLIRHDIPAQNTAIFAAGYIEQREAQKMPRRTT